MDTASSSSPVPPSSQFATVQDVPADVELTPEHAIDALNRAFAEMTGTPRAHFTLTDSDVRVAGRWVIVKLRFVGLESNEITLRVRKSWADKLRVQLNRAMR